MKEVILCGRWMRLGCLLFFFFENLKKKSESLIERSFHICSTECIYAIMYMEFV